MLAALPSALSANAGVPGRLIRLIAVGTCRRSSPACSSTITSRPSCGRRWSRPIALAVGAVVMLIAERASRTTRDEAGLTMADALLIGLAQACALVPGVSRSGATIAVGMLLGVRREAAARFTFLLAIPAILAAAGKESIELRHMHPDAQLLTLFAVGAGVSALVGYLTIKYFLRYPGPPPAGRVRILSARARRGHPGAARTLTVRSGSRFRVRGNTQRPDRRPPTSDRRRVPSRPPCSSGFAAASSPGSSSPCRW